MDSTLPKPRLLIVLNRLSIGGPATNTLAIAHALQHDFDVFLIAGEPASGEESAAYLLKHYNGFKVQMLKSMKRAVLPVNDYHSYRQIKQVIQEFRPHIIHTHGSKPGVIARLAAYNNKVPLIVHTYHGHVFHSYFKPFLSKLIVKLEHWLAIRSSFIIAINERLKEELITVYRIAPAQKVILNRLGIETGFMQDAEGRKRNHFRNEFQLTKEEIAIGIIGRLVPVKQHSLFLEMASQILHSAANTKPVRFFIIGDGDERQNMERKLEQLKVNYTEAGKNFNAQAPVVFTSWRKDMDVVMAGLDIVTLTSVNEGTPVSIMEAMAAAKPVVAADVGGIAELFENGKNGLLFGKQEDFILHIRTLINSKETRFLTGQNAKNYAVAQLSLQYQVEALQKAYFQYLKHGKL
jgi:glycosyltransferase involved in cell wall biosynthesis